ncbi:MAG TPA: VOC family protein [Candidatus Kapabacteria bacterium]|nr:VOC family protein [Candidatus Kapabacteria bacterium]
MNKKMSADTNALNWFEIAVNDMERASKFYETIFDVKLIPAEMPGAKLAMFPTNGSNGTVGGSLVQSNRHHPSSVGSIIYLNANPDLQAVLSRIEKIGAKVVMPKTRINEDAGYMAFFTDSEGNTVGLHSYE